MYFSSKLFRKVETTTFQVGRNNTNDEITKKVEKDASWFSSKTEIRRRSFEFN